MAGRPSKYSEELANKICVKIVQGKTLTKISKELGFSLYAFFEWLQKYESFAKKYARAKQEQADILVEEILDIADESNQDTIKDKDNNNLTNHENIARSRLRVDTRKWIASKMKPKKYGDFKEKDDEDKEPISMNITLKRDK